METQWNGTGVMGLSMVPQSYGHGCITVTDVMADS